MPSWKVLRSRFDNYWGRLYDSERRALKALAVLVVLLVLAPIVYFGFAPLWQHWRHRQALAQAAAFAGQNDTRNLLLALQRATQIQPGDVGTWRQVAAFLDELGLGDALLAHENIVALAPDDLSARLSLASTALRFNQPARARDVFTGLDPDAPRQEEIHRLAAELARALGDQAAFEQHLVALLVLRPEDPEATYNLAIIRLWSPDPVRQQNGLAALESLLDRRSLRVRAALELLKHAARSRDPDRAGQVVRLLISRLPAPVSSSAWDRLRVALKAAAGEDGAGDIALVARWFGTVRLGPEALAWIDDLPSDLHDAPAVRDITAELCAQLGNLPRLQPLLLEGAWGQIPPDALLLALAARTQHLHRSEPRGRATWDDAIAACADSPSGLRILSRLAQAWQNADAVDAALRALLQIRPKTTWAYAALRSSYIARGDSLKLFQLYETWLPHQPDEPALIAAWIRLGSVLDRVSPEMQSRAAALSATSPVPPEIVLGHASLLWRLRQHPQALAMLMTLSPADRARPEAAFWLTLVQAELEHKAEASASLAQVDPASLTKEELTLLKSAAGKANLTLPASLAPSANEGVYRGVIRSDG